MGVGITLYLSFLLWYPLTVVSSSTYLPLFGWSFMPHVKTNYMIMLPKVAYLHSQTAFMPLWFILSQYLLTGHKLSSHYAEMNMVNDTFIFFAPNTFSHLSYLKALPKILACSLHSRRRLKVSLPFLTPASDSLFWSTFSPWYFLSSKRPCIALLTVHLLLNC